MRGRSSLSRRSASRRALGACNPAGYPTCYRVECPYPPVYQNSYVGYVPAYAPGGPAFGEAPFDDPFSDYTQRSPTISPGAGNAQAANLALQTATPWPRYSSNTNIPGNGAQMVKRSTLSRAAGVRPSGRPCPRRPYNNWAHQSAAAARRGGRAPRRQAGEGTERRS